MSTREKMNKGELYTDMGEGLPEERCAGKERVYDFNLTRPSEEAKRLQLLKSIMGSLGESCWIEPPLRVAYGTHIHIGNHFYANFNLTVVDDATVTIGNNVMIAPNVTLATAGHPIDPDIRITGQQFSLPIVIEDNVWLGTGVIVNPGVTIGRNSVIGAGSVVTKSIPPDVVAAGVPCRVLRPITASDREAFLK
ncbi:maltose acetyltransferase domain-containing protein [Rahnella victoriana]|jgi:galactoside O-acetyltransferase|uniref:maltose acetyltransferase domain-containing protein n=1 Tax=Rahnella victoriana TaxID=1510570 RepID=UPI000BB1B949|nr:maltose acetyltransferase domain-containing protein [Rahnella victoriana]PBI81551.1 galactoside O-acetyltransferase [Rahnella victoriana]UHM91807.1 galactoside O-acetyltransferase [Rahnella victoriana]